MHTLCLGCMKTFDDEYKICPHCGYAVGTKADETIHIKPGTRLHDRYIVGKVLGFGGFGVTYIAWDERLEQRVAIKEYLPSEFSTRTPGQTQVSVFGGEKSQQFNDGLSKFVDEAKKLAKFQNESGIVKIFDSFQENSTAYIIMEYLKGETLASYMDRMGPLDEQDAVAMLMPVMESLQVVHAEGIIHRDIAPDNIFLTDEGEVKLIDFGASRYATTSHSRSLTVVIKQGYSPEEQYRSKGDHGPHTDVYALSATLYKMITGKIPPDAMERRVKYETKSKDILEDPRKFNKKLSKNRTNAILNALNVRIEDRTPTVAAFIDELNADPPTKRIYGKIKLIDRLRWPLWLKITVPTLFIVILTLGVLLLTGIINFSKFSQEIVIPDGVVSVPEVEGLYTDEAIDIITKANLLASTDGTIESEYIPAGKIILQTPVGGSYINVNGTVLLTVSSGKGVVSPENGLATVPYVIWETKDNAVAKLIQAGLAEPEIVERHDNTVSLGAVIAQSINAGEKVEEGTKITLTISLGPASFEMPNVIGKTKDNAESILNNKGLVVVVEYKKTDKVAEGSVINQNVSAGASVKRGDKIIITVSSGRETIDVANVVGMTRTEAENTLREQGFEVTVLENYNSNITAGKVISQSPNAGIAQLPDSIIVIYVSKGKQPITITYDANGGAINTHSKSTYLSDPYGTLPVPTRTGYTFAGWYSAKSGGVKVTADTIIETPSSHTIYAIWKANTYSISFNSNGGGTAPESKNVIFGSKYGDLGSVSRTGYTFNGWYTAASGGSKVTEKTTCFVASNQTLYAQWKANNYTISFNANGGSVSSTSTIVTYDSTYGTLPTPTKTGYNFDGWFTATSGGLKVTASTTVKITSTQTLYAQWSLINSTVTFNANGGSVSPSTITVTYSYAYGDLPTPTRTGYTFNGWYTSSNGGTQITSSTTVLITSPQTLYAQWNVNSYKLTYNANGGNISTSSKTVNYGATYGTLPTPTRDYYTFNGWYTAASGGTKVSSSTTMGLGNTTIYAQWTQNPLSDWVLASDVPTGAQIVENKWTYTRTQTTESTNSSLSGWTQTGSYWDQTGSGSTNYATFPTGFDTTNTYYTSFAKSPYSAYDNGSTKRVVSNAWEGYIYWHWMYSVTYSNSTDRAISHRVGSWDADGNSGGKNYKYFFAIASSVDCPYLDKLYCCSQSLPSYNCHSIITDTTNVGTPRCFRFDYYTSSYIDYQKVYQYQKVTTGNESTTQVTSGGEISNVQHYVRYREK